MNAAAEAPALITPVTVYSLGATVAILGAAYGASVTLLPKSSSTKLRILYIWHTFDYLIHFILEGSFVYNSLFVYKTVPVVPAPEKLYHPIAPYFLGYNDRTYGPLFGENPFSYLWQEYARADKRWGESDPTIVTMEIITVIGAGGLALYVTELIRQGAGTPGHGKLTAKLWFWASVLATAELYGGYMTFAPEWISGSTNLVTDNFMYKWVYLFFFNTLWVWIPLWVLYEAYQSVVGAFLHAGPAKESKKQK